MDNYFQLPQRDVTSPLFAPIDGVVGVKDRGTVIITTIEKGSVKKNDKLEVMGFGAKFTTSVADIQAFGKPLSGAQAGDHVGYVGDFTQSRQQLTFFSKASFRVDTFRSKHYIQTKLDREIHPLFPGFCAEA